MNKFTKFVQEAIQELKLASWLSRPQMIGSTVVVLIFTSIMAVYVALVDRALLFLTGILFRIG